MLVLDQALSSLDLQMIILYKLYLEILKMQITVFDLWHLTHISTGGGGFRPFI